MNVAPISAEFKVLINSFSQQMADQEKKAEEAQKKADLASEAEANS
jgi:hypothetical protein